MRSGEIAIVTHVNPFSSGSGQIQRVFNSLLAIAKDWDKISVYTLHPEQSNPGKLQEVININTSVKVVYLKLPALLPVLKPVFYLLPYLGFGKSSNWILPFIFRQLDGFQRPRETERINPACGEGRKGNDYGGNRPEGHQPRCTPD